MRARIFSGGFLHLFKTSRDLCDGCKNQSKEVHVLFVISEPQNTAQSKSLEKNILNVCQNTEERS